MSLKASYEEMMQDQLDQWSAEIERLEARVQLADAQARVAYLEQIEDLRSQRDAARGRLEELRDAGNDAWEDLKAGMDAAWKSLGDSVHDAASRFK
ncbi:MAG: coiled coil domain-containing protein [Gammaproteobacteria bacterium]|nr:coiled coil domain-containing protein [Gammaproteobacteria bacterium]MCP5201893.1 coiled coil domain-containing protein [Gammaproteobacteria bacterium]